MTVLCLVELDGATGADVSLRALTFARALAGDGGVAAVVFAAPDAVPVVELSAYGVADAYVTGKKK